MTSNEINWLLFSLFVLAALVQASAALVRLWTPCASMSRSHALMSIERRPINLPLVSGKRFQHWHLNVSLP